MSITYEMRLKDGSTWIISSECDVLHDGSRHTDFAGLGTWKILGITKRFNSHKIISLAEAADGADLGQGWVHDLDHGSYRVWRQPSNRRVVSVRRIFS
jgi:hypothetical protein